MTRGRGPYPYTCSGCGQMKSARQAWAARRNGPCLGCIRAANGWQHSAACNLPPDHPNTCDLAAAFEVAP
jgi:hypothetical protein